MEFGAWLKRKRKSLDLSRAALATRAGCSAATLVRVEGGALRLSADLARKLALALELPPAERDDFVMHARGARDAAVEPPQSDLVHPPIPQPPNAFTGRARELSALLARLRNHEQRLITLTGTAGIGKTRLALALAQAAQPLFMDGARVVTLAQIDDASRVPAAVARALQLVPDAFQSPEDAIGAHLQDKQLLLVLDNFEHVHAAAGHVAAWLARCPRLTVLVTSRTLLNLYGEHAFAVPLLGTPQPGTAKKLVFQRVIRHASVQLFCERARAVNPEFHLDDHNAATVARICAWTQGLPLAVEMVAARTRGRSLVDLEHSLREHLIGFEPPLHDLSERQLTLRGALAWSDALLRQDERRLLYRLSVFAGSFDAEAAYAVHGAGVSDVLQGLFGHSLLLQLEPGRHMLLEMVREYAHEQLVAHDEPASVRQAHAEYYAALAWQAYDGFIGSEGVIWNTRVTAEIDNFRAALQHCLQHGLVMPALCIATGIWRFWWRQGLHTEGMAWIQQALALPRGGDFDQLMLSKAMRAAGALAIACRDYARAKSWLLQAAGISDALGEQEHYLAALSNLGLACTGAGEFNAAIRFYNQAISVEQRLSGKILKRKSTKLMLATLYMSMGDAAAAGPLFAQAMTYNQALGDSEGIANAHFGLAEVALANGDLGTARKHARHGLERFKRLQHHNGMAWCHLTLGKINTVARRWRHAQLQLQHALGHAQARNDLVTRAHALDQLARVLLATHQPARARACLSEADALLARTGAVITQHEQAQRVALHAACAQER